MDRIGTPSGFQSIVWTFVRHTVGRCLIFPALPEVAKVTWAKWTNSQYTWLPPDPYLWVNMGCALAIVFPLRSHFNSPPLGICFRESLVCNRLHSEIDQIHLSIEAQCGTACLPMGDCHSILSNRTPGGLSRVWGRLYCFRKMQKKKKIEINMNSIPKSTKPSTSIKWYLFP